MRVATAPDLKHDAELVFVDDSAVLFLRAGLLAADSVEFLDRLLRCIRIK